MSRDVSLSNLRHQTVAVRPLFNENPGVKGFWIAKFRTHDSLTTIPGQIWAKIWTYMNNAFRYHRKNRSC